MNPRPMHYLDLARAHGLAVRGGSDYHGEDGRRKRVLASRAPERSISTALARVAQEGRPLMAAAFLTATLRRSRDWDVARLSWPDRSQHRRPRAAHLIGIFSTMITMLSHSMMMFYFLGKGKAVREAAAKAAFRRSSNIGSPGH